MLRSKTSANSSNTSFNAAEIEDKWVVAGKDRIVQEASRPHITIMIQ